MIKLEDIAKIAGVSKATVSLALNDKPGISDERREQIRKIAKDNNYIPLRKTKQNSRENEHQELFTIRFVACTNDEFITNNYQSSPFFSELLQDMSKLSKDYPISLIINSVSLENFENELNELDNAQKADGIILLGTSLCSDFIDKFIEKFPNTVIIDSCHLHSNYDYISMNNFHGSYISTKHLIDNGHKKIGYLKGKPTIPNFSQRFSGFKRAMHDNNTKIYENYIYELPGNEITSEIDFLDIKDLPTAFVCDNDYIAISLIKSLQKNNIKVPEEVSVVGFDNISESRVITPELTTIEVNSKEIVRQSINKIIDKIKDKNHIPTQILVSNNLIIRASSRSI